MLYNPNNGMYKCKKYVSVNHPKDWAPFWETHHYFMFNSTGYPTQKHEPFFLIDESQEQ